MLLCAVALLVEADSPSQQQQILSPSKHTPGSHPQQLRHLVEPDVVDRGLPGKVVVEASAENEPTVTATCSCRLSDSTNCHCLGDQLNEKEEAQVKGHKWFAPEQFEEDLGDLSSKTTEELRAKLKEVEAKLAFFEAEAEVEHLFPSNSIQTSSAHQA